MGPLPKELEVGASSYIAHSLTDYAQQLHLFEISANACSTGQGEADETTLAGVDS